MSWTSDQAKALAERILSFSKAAECEVSLRLSRDRAHAVRRQRDHDRRHGPERLGRDHQPRGRQERLDHDRRARRLVAPRGRRPQRGPDGRGAARPRAGREPRARRTIPTIPAFDDATAAAGPVERRDGVKAALDRARGRGPQRLGLLRDRRPLARRSPTRRATSASTARPSPNTRPRCAPPTAPARATRGSARRGSPTSTPAALAERAAKRPSRRPSRATCRRARTP